MSPTVQSPQIAQLNVSQNLPVLANWALVVAAAVTTWDTRYRSRKDLRKLSDQHLKDIGMDRHTAKSEGRKPFWQA